MAGLRPGTLMARKLVEAAVAAHSPMVMVAAVAQETAHRRTAATTLHGFSASANSGSGGGGGSGRYHGGQSTGSGGSGGSGIILIRYLTA